MSINLIRYEGHAVAPKYDVNLMKRIFEYNGIFSGCVLSHPSDNVIKITNGAGIIQGADIEILEENINVVLPSAGISGGWVYIKIDMSDYVNPVKFLSVLEINGLEPSWVQESDVYETNGVYEFPICQYIASQTAVTSFYDKANRISLANDILIGNQCDDWRIEVTYPLGSFVKNKGFIYKKIISGEINPEPPKSDVWEKIKICNEIFNLVAKNVTSTVYNANSLIVKKKDNLVTLNFTTVQAFPSGFTKIAATIPSGSRPTFKLYLSIVGNSSSTIVGYGIVTIDTSGTINIATNYTGSAQWSFDTTYLI